MDKASLRTSLRKTRDAISNERRNEGEALALKALEGFFLTYPHTLSYCSFNSEMGTELINAHLAKAGQLLLPKVQDDTLEIYHVENPETDLVLHPYGFMEPNPKRCKKAEIKQNILALIPGIAFDQARHRLGYGKGYYDRFLSKNGKQIDAFGLGFQEQLVESLPTSDHDISLHGLFLF